MNQTYVRYGIISVGILIYIISISQMMTYSPSTMSCLNTKGYINRGLLFMSAITSLVFLSIYLTVLDKGHSPTPILITLVLCVFTIGLGVYFFFRCSSINADVNERLGDYSGILALEQNYEPYTGAHLPISKCMSYHSGDYYKNSDISCRAIEGCNLNNTVACDSKNGAKLNDFYVASSHQSCRVPITSGNYVSIQMLKLVLKAGARFVDFDIYEEIVKDEVIPVVRSSWKNSVSYNYIPIEDIWNAISEYGFVKQNGDPLIVHLNLHTNNIGVLDKIANSYVQSMNGANVLAPIYSYHSKKTIGKEAICKLFNKCIVAVTGDCYMTSLDELVNLHTSHNARILEAKTVKNPTEPSTFAYTNQNIFTIVKPNEWEENTNPETAWTHGVQAFMMNYWSFSKLMISHCDFFKKSSFVMKGLNLQLDRIEPKKIENNPIIDEDATTISTN